MLHAILLKNLIVLKWQEGIVCILCVALENKCPMLRTDKRRVDKDWLNSYILQILTKDSVTVFVNAIMYYKVLCHSQS